MHRSFVTAVFLLALPAQAQTFTDVSDLLPPRTFTGFAGAAMVDADGDGRTDIARSNELFLQREGEFTSVSYNGEFGGDFPLGSVFGDVAGDGRPEVFVLYANEPDLLRYDPARETLAPIPGGGLDVRVPLVQGSILFDYDRDGLLDALIGNDGGIDVLFRGLGKGRFENTSSILPQLSRGDYGMMAADYDRDGDTDVYVGLCAGVTENLLYRNDGGAFTEVAAAAGVDDPGQGWGVVWLDYDNDGWADLFVANKSGSETAACSGTTRTVRSPT